jgi:cyclase
MPHTAPPGTRAAVSGGSRRHGTSRRDLLRGAAAAVAGFALPGIAPVGNAQDSRAAGQLGETPLGNGLTMLTGARGNLLAHTTAEGLVLVDSGAAADRPALQGWLVEHGVDRIAAVFNTHWHPDQVGANETFGAAGARIFAHEKTRQRLTAGYYRPDEDRYVPPLAAAGLPTETFYDSGTTAIGGQRIDYAYLLEAHTDGDIYVAIPERNVIAVGDAVASAGDPILDWYGGGWLGGRLDAQARLLAISDAETRFVPGFGPVIGRAAAQAVRPLRRTHPSRRDSARHAGGRTARRARPRVR